MEAVLLGQTEAMVGFRGFLIVRTVGGYMDFEAIKYNHES
jgi:hypothetical protein